MNAAATIDNTIYRDYKQHDDLMRELLTHNILAAMVDKSYNNKGELDKDKFADLYTKIKNEIDSFGIKESKTLKSIVDSYTRTELGIFDDDIESVKDAINKPNRLFDEIKHKNNIANYLKDTECSPSEVFGLLYKLTTTDEGKSRIIEEFASNPRIGQDIKDLLLRKLGGNKKAEKYFNTWFFDE